MLDVTIAVQMPFIVHVSTGLQVRIHLFASCVLYSILVTQRLKCSSLESCSETIPQELVFASSRVLFSTLQPLVMYINAHIYQLATVNQARIFSPSLRLLSRASPRRRAPRALPLSDGTLFLLRLGSEVFLHPREMVIDRVNRRWRGFGSVHAMP